MAFRIGGGRTRPQVDAGSLRRSQIITTYGCGAIVDVPGNSVVMAGTDFWEQDIQKQYIITEETLQKLLGAEYFVSPPPSLDELGSETGLGVPAFRFPLWMYCPACEVTTKDEVTGKERVLGKPLFQARNVNLRGKPVCPVCQGFLVPSRFVIACENGHLDEFPYKWWVHSYSKCTGKPQLYLHFDDKKSGLDSIVIGCRTCGNNRSMAGSFGEEALKIKCSGKRPWLNDQDPAPCDKTLRTMQRGATNLHFGVTFSALSIPPWSKKVQLKLGQRWKDVESFINDQGFFERMVKGWGWPEYFGCSATDIWKQATNIKKGRETTSVSWKEVLEGEYRAFCKGSDKDDGEFKTREEPVPRILSSYVDQIVLGLRIREVLALKGFKRINPDYDINDLDGTLIPLSNKELKWLPAVELFGEGIFIKINEEIMRSWENRIEILDRYAKICNKGKLRSGICTPRYIFLHTLAHLLIRQMTFQSGYGSAAIKERIYSTVANSADELPMAGILIYTASGDSEGSLGGLVREGGTRRLDDTFRSMLEVASWCSSDPLCIQSGGQGLNAMNLAACHACTLLPETSCEARNLFLDRASVVGTIDKPDIGFFHSALRGQE